MIVVVATIVTSKECNQNCPPLTNISHIGKIDPPHLHLLQIQDATNCWEQHSQDRPNLPSEAANTAWFKYHHKPHQWQCVALVYVGLKLKWPWLSCLELCVLGESEKSYRLFWVSNQIITWEEKCFSWYWWTGDVEIAMHKGRLGNREYHHHHQTRFKWSSHIIHYKKSFVTNIWKIR